MNDIRASSFKHIIVLAFFHDIACIEEINVIIRRQSAAGEYAVAVFGNVGIKNYALVFPREKIRAHIMAPAADAFAIRGAR